MAWRAPAVLPVPPMFEAAITTALTARALQHQDELTEFLTWTQELTPPVTFNVIVEIGTASGAMLAGWAELARDLAVGLDLPSAWAGLPLTECHARDAKLQERYPHLRTILGNSHDPDVVRQLADLLAGRQIDLLFIDGDHSRWGVEEDYHWYRPFVRSGGIIAFHDANDSERNRTQGLGVADFFATLPEPKRLFSIGQDWGGIGAVVMP